MSNEIKTSLLNEAYENFEKGLFGDSVTIIDKALSLCLDDEEVIFASKCVKFWKEIEFKISKLENDITKGDCLLKAWKSFNFFLNDLKPENEKCKDIIKRWCFEKALSFFYKSFKGLESTEPDILFRLGRSYKGIDKYNNAGNCFESAYRQKKDDAAIIAELADCFALINEPEKAKLYFREAFFLDPQKIEFEFLESFLIKKLIDNLKAKNYSAEEIKEWIPVYGVVYNVFNVERLLDAHELGFLNQSIHTYEKRFNNEAGTNYSTAPRLLNYYFRLIEHYKCAHEDRGAIDEVLRKIKKIDNDIFIEYIN